VDYRIHRAKHDLESTGFIEIGAGRYTGVHWRDGSLFVWEDAFSVVEGVIAKNFPSYDHLAPNDIPKVAGERIASEWRAVADGLPNMSSGEAKVALGVADWLAARFDEELETHRADITALLRGLAKGCDDFYAKGEWICVLGV
jgi:hypothetical protein